MPDGVSPRMAGETVSPAGAERRPRGRGGPEEASAHVWLPSVRRARAVALVAVRFVAVPLAAGFLLGRAVVLETLHPFGVAFVVALAANGRRGQALAAAFGVLLASLLSSPGSPIDSPAAVLVFVWLFAALSGRVFNLSPRVNVTATMLGAATLRTVAAAFSGDSVPIAAAAGAVDLTAAWSLLPVASRLFGPGRIRRGDGPAPLDGARAASVLVFAALLLVGTAGLEWLGYSVSDVLFRLFLLLGAVVGGVGVGAAAGTFLAVLTLLGDGSALWQGAVLAAAGLGSGVGAQFVWSRSRRTATVRGGETAGAGPTRRGGADGLLLRIGAVVGLFVVQLLLSALAPGGGDVGDGIAHAVLAGAGLVFFPEGWLERWRSVVQESGIGMASRRPGEAAASAWRRQLLRVAGAFDQAAAGLAGEFPPPFGDPIAHPRAEAAPGEEDVSGEKQDIRSGGDRDAPAAEHQFGRWDDIGPGVGAAAGAGGESGENGDILGTRDAFDRFVGDVRKQVCRGCSNEAICWDVHGWQTYRDVLALVADVGPDARRGPALSPGDLPPGLRHRCIQLQHFTRGVERLLALVHDKARTERQIRRWQAPLQRQLSGLAEVIAGVADEIRRLEQAKEGDSETGDGRVHPRFQISTDSVQVPGDVAVVSGDSMETAYLPDDRMAFIVCDGMGSGARAAAESRAVAAMLRRFLEAGFDLRFTVQTINSVMLLRAAEESFVTLDVSIVDLRDGTVHIAKTGAAPTFIHRGDDVEMVRADSLPIGILPAVEVYEARVQLNLGDVVVMMSDGALELAASRGDKGEAVRRHLGRVERLRPKALVDGLFSRARRLPGSSLPDDVTIVAAQLVPAVVGAAVPRGEPGV